MIGVCALANIVSSIASQYSAALGTKSKMSSTGKTSRLQLVSILALTMTLALVGSHGLETRRTKLHSSRLPANTNPLEYHVSLSLLDGFAALKGKATIVLKFAGRRATYFGRKFTAAVSKCCQREPDDSDDEESDHILLHLDGRLLIRNVTLDVSSSIKKVRNGLGRRVRIDEIMRDDEKQLISIHLRKPLPLSGYFGRLSIRFASSDQLFMSKLKSDKQLVLNRQKPPRVTRLQPGHTRQLFPCFDDPRFESKLRITFYQPDIDTTVVSNVARVGQDVTMLQVATGASFKKIEFKQTEPIEIGSLSFALGPFFPTSNNGQQRDLSKVLSIAQQRGDGLANIGDFARGCLRRSLDWMSNYLSGISDQLQVVGALEGEYLVIGAGSVDSLGPSVETALTMALVVARKGLELVGSKSHSGHWITDGLVAHLAIRMVRELEPSLHVDRFARSRLLPRALALDASNEHAQMELAHEIPTSEEHLPAILVRLVKGAAIVEMVRRNIALKQSAFDRAVLSLVKDNAFNGIGLQELADAFASNRFTKDQIVRILKPWVELEGFPYIGVSLDRNGRSIRIDQVPISWLVSQDSRRVKADGVWPLALQVKFSTNSRSETRDVHITSFMNDRASARIKIPHWFEPTNSEHKFWLALEAQSLPYYRVSYAID